MARTPLIAGNWKMYKTGAAARELAAAVAAGARDVTGVEILVCPPFTALAAVRGALAGSAVKLGAQNCHFDAEGAYTGEVSAAMLIDAGCEYVILGHSERRHIFGEEDEFVNKKVKAALATGLKPIVCVGETLAQRENGDAWKALIRAQVGAGLNGVTASDMNGVVVAYEPVWAIGTGKTASPAQAAEAHAVVRRALADGFGDTVAASTRVLYGGSVKPENVKELMAEPDIDGALVGGASLKAESFLGIIRFGG